jgi:hypothetical protein
MGRKETRQVRERRNNEESRSPVNEGRRVRLSRIRNRSEVLLVKVRKAEEWLQTYKEFMVAKEALCESTGVRRTRSGDILVELKAGVKVGDVALKIKKVTEDSVFVSPLQTRISVEIRDIDPLESMEDLKQDIASGLRITDVSKVEVKSLRAAPWGTQTVIVVVPASYISGKEGSMKIRTGLTKATMRVPSNPGSVLVRSDAVNAARWVT